VVITNPASFEFVLFGQSESRSIIGDKSPLHALRPSNSLISVRLGLWDGVGTIQKKGHNFFEYFFAHVYGTVDAVAWL
jgi:hypothetical protein